MRYEETAGQAAEALRARGSARILALETSCDETAAAVDFDGLFVTFHRVAFRNDGWLLDPRTDLLIRLMPEQLFVRMGIRGGIAAAVWVLLLYIAAEALKGKKK